MSTRNLLFIVLLMVSCYDNTSEIASFNKNIAGVRCLVGAGKWCYNNGISGGATDMLYTCPGRDLEATNQLYCSRGCKIMPSGTDDVCNPPEFKLPLSSGYKWKVNTEARSGKCGSSCTDGDHISKFAIDFGRHIKDNQDTPSSFGDGVVNVFAAAEGTVVEVVNSNCINYDPDVTCVGAYAQTCRVIIDHGGGYRTRYLHFTDTKVEVRVGDHVTQGQYLGKMGNTGCSSGVHLHFEVHHNGSSSTSSAALNGLALEGLDFIDDYKFGDYSKSTNGFTYTSSPDNPHTCSTEPVNGSPCTHATTFNIGSRVWSNLRLTDLSKDICFKVEFYLGNTKKAESSEWCSDRIESDGGWNNAFLWESFVPQETGTNWNARHFVKLKNGGTSYLPNGAGMAVSPYFTVSDAPPTTPTLISPISVPAFPPTTEVNASPIPLSWTNSSGANYYRLIFFIWDEQWNQAGLWNVSANPIDLIGVPPNRYCAWAVSACSVAGCSNWSDVGYFKTLP